ncbi:sec-independent translocase [Nocardioides zeae]|uniref:Sec-independent translocase n=1 Tax=Nocardioides imazamoxiresistens TaxID=3231893 RepID=A0ABU3Q0B8_9ACTN|nr:sec-independent translocase [Nocardioides zeae]MDT9594909.1 sec-independent translocase [Nocardioides zeae]
MFGIGLPELAVIALVAMIVLGPDRLPQVAKQAGQMIRQVRRMANNARDDLRDELGPEYADLELRDLDPRVIVRKHVMEALAEEDDEASRPGGRPLAPGELPPYDTEAT